MKKPGDDGYWTMPEWMEPYRDIVEAGGGGNSAERLMNFDESDRLGVTNVILAGLCIATEARVNTLRTLRKRGLLREVVSA